MKPINIYALSRLTTSDRIKRMDRQMSERDSFLSVKDWEIESLKALSDRLYQTDPRSSRLSYYYSFSIPKLGKEFDLLYISKDQIINIELKSHPVSDEDIKKQLLLNRGYLSVLGKTIRSYTYISSTNRLLRLTGKGHLADTDFDTLCINLLQMTDLYTDHVEKLFKEEAYLIAPLQEPYRFLRGEYYLTAQQRDIKERILSDLQKGEGGFFGFTGLPGTGKTLLLYDLAVALSEKERVLLLPMRTEPAAVEMLDKRLKRIDFRFADDLPSLDLSSYTAVLVDEAHLMTKELITRLMISSEAIRLPMIFSYDLEEAISKKERNAIPVEIIEGLSDYRRFHLTNRIRMNAELSSFVNNLVRKSGNHRSYYPSVKLVYANDKKEEAILLDSLISEGYRYLKPPFAHSYTDTSPERVVMVIDESFYYDEEGYLRAHASEGLYPVRDLFEGLGKARSNLALVVTDNEAVFDVILHTIQNQND